MLFDVLCDEAHSFWAVFAFVPEPDDFLAIVCLTDMLDVLLQTFVRKCRRRRCCLRGRSRQCASAFGNPGQELSHLERITLLLLELVIECRQTGLLRLLRNRACLQCSLATSDRGILCATAQLGKRVGPGNALVIDLVAQATLSACCPCILVKELLPGLPCCGTVCLRRTEINTLLAVKFIQRLSVALVQKTTDNIAGRHLLLAHQSGLRQSCTITAKCTRTNCVSGQFGLILLLLLLQRSQCPLDDIVHIRVHVLINALLAKLPGVNRHRALLCQRDRA